MSVDLVRDCGRNHFLLERKSVFHYRSVHVVKRLDDVVVAGKNLIALFSDAVSARAARNEQVYRVGFRPRGDKRSLLHGRVAPYIERYRYALGGFFRDKLVRRRGNPLGTESRLIRINFDMRVGIDFRFAAAGKGSGARYAHNRG